MNLRLLATPLLATGLLLSTLGCSKKEEPAPAASGSYLLDGRTINCTVTADVQTLTSSGTSAPSRNLLAMRLITTPEPASGPEKLELFFTKQATQPSKAYLLSDIFLTNAATPNGVKYDNVTITLTEDSELYSGSFEGSRMVTPFTAITAGNFKNVRPY